MNNISSPKLRLTEEELQWMPIQKIPPSPRWKQIFATNLLVAEISTFLDKKDLLRLGLCNKFVAKHIEKGWRNLQEMLCRMIQPSKIPSSTQSRLVWKDAKGSLYPEKSSYIITELFLKILTLYSYGDGDVCDHGCLFMPGKQPIRQQIKCFADLCYDEKLIVSGESCDWLQGWLPESKCPFPHFQQLIDRILNSEQHKVELVKEDIIGNGDLLLQLFTQIEQFYRESNRLQEHPIKSYAITIQPSVVKDNGFLKFVLRKIYALKAIENYEEITPYMCDVDPDFVKDLIREGRFNGMKFYKNGLKSLVGLGPIIDSQLRLLRQTNNHNSEQFLQSLITLCMEENSAKYLRHAIDLYCQIANIDRNRSHQLEAFTQACQLYNTLLDRKDGNSSLKPSLFFEDTFYFESIPTKGLITLSENEKKIEYIEQGIGLSLKQIEKWRECGQFQVSQKYLKDFFIHNIWMLEILREIDYMKGDNTLFVKNASRFFNSISAFFKKLSKKEGGFWFIRDIAYAIVFEYECCTQIRKWWIEQGLVVCKWERETLSKKIPKHRAQASFEIEIDRTRIELFAQSRIIEQAFLAELARIS